MNASGPPSAELQTAKALSRAFIEVAKKVTPAVVNISSTRVERGQVPTMSPLFRRFFPDFDDMFVQPQREVRSLGSGVIVRPDGYIVTNWHVIQGAEEITVKLSDEREFDAKLVGQDSFTDLAVIKIEQAGLPTAGLGDSSKLEVGEWVIAVGSPLGLAKSVTQGIVSAIGRKNLGIQGYEDFIQTDAAINPGNSGGALVNLDGEVVGINAAIASEGGGYDGICFATPTSVVWPVVDALIRDGAIRRPWIGILPKNIDDSLAKRLELPSAAGVLVSNIVRDAPAQKGCLLPGDVITQWGDTKIETRADLAEAMQRTSIGDTADLIIVRKGKKYRATVTVTQRPQAAALKGLL